MPLIQTPDGTGKEIIKCKGYCSIKGKEKLYCGIGCRNIKKVTKEKQNKIKEIEKDIYYASSLKIRKELRKKINYILDQNKINWNKLKDIEKSFY